MQQAVQRLVDDWSARAWEYRPWGMWVLLWGAIQDDRELEDARPEVPLRAAWFLTSTGFVRRDAWSYLRYQAARQSAIETLPVRGAPAGVGVLEVAPYRDGVSVYASAYYGPLNAYGLRLEQDDRGRLITHRLWVS